MTTVDHRTDTSRYVDALVSTPSNGTPEPRRLHLAPTASMVRLHDAISPEELRSLPVRVSHTTSQLGVQTYKVGAHDSYREAWGLRVNLDPRHRAIIIVLAHGATTGDLQRAREAARLIRDGQKSDGWEEVSLPREGRALVYKLTLESGDVATIDPDPVQPCTEEGCAEVWHGIHDRHIIAQAHRSFGDLSTYQMEVSKPVMDDDEEGYRLVVYIDDFAGDQVAAAALIADLQRMGEKLNQARAAGRLSGAA
ncbi:hypothetical protein [Microbacterium oleivorans]|uniref:Uncharacterized protein n=1 Tax=Microbacterium oleivorans TaxID=273677 RepID=A0A7D5EVH4_9MICO|nr:hypothetical protein [Microbacterium oleivorans]QLD11371.1 hypothetical protein HW566_06035 [Microbacterium oleivorans]